MVVGGRRRSSVVVAARRCPSVLSLLGGAVISHLVNPPFKAGPRRPRPLSFDREAAQTHRPEPRLYFGKTRLFFSFSRTRPRPPRRVYPVAVLSARWSGETRAGGSRIRWCCFSPPFLSLSRSVRSFGENRNAAELDASRSGVKRTGAAAHFRRALSK